ncbi:MAG: radical SAM/SPASM domain-containing protein [Planctomycetota bacterium]|jgi:MoaA/NifB/PqqE/SkfB family radical SAM enzyme
MNLWLERARAAILARRHPEARRMPLRVSLQLLRGLRDIRPSRSPTGTFLHLYAPPIDGRAFGRYVEGIARRTEGEAVPVVVHLSLTDRCPMRCARCSNVATTTEDPPLGDVLDVIGQLRDAGTSVLALTGGEPALRRDLADVVAGCGEAMAVTLFTSGVGVDAAKARGLAHAGLASAYVSLDDHRGDLHDRGRGMEGASDAARGAIGAFLDAKVHTAVQAVVAPEFVSDGLLGDFIDSCADLGVHDVMLLEEVTTAPRGPSGTELVCALRDAHVRSAREATRPKVSSMCFLESPEYLGCQAGYAFAYVSAAGEVFPCDFVPTSFGNAYRLGVQEVLDRMALVFRAPRRTCLARELGPVLSAARTKPLCWAETRSVYSGYRPGRPPRMAFSGRRRP